MQKIDDMQIVSGVIGKQEIHYIAPPSNQIEPEIDNFFIWWDTPNLDGIIRAAIAHFR